MKPVIKCSDCTKDKKCLRHHDYDSSEYVVLSPGPKEKRLMAKIDFKKLDAIIDKRLENKEAKFKCEICGGDIASSDYAGNAIERYAGSSLRMLGAKITFRIDKEWIICTKCGDKIHARLQAGED